MEDLVREMRTRVGKGRRNLSLEKRRLRTSFACIIYRKSVPPTPTPSPKLDAFSLFCESERRVRAVEELHVKA